MIRQKRYFSSFCGEAVCVAWEACEAAEDRLCDYIVPDVVHVLKDGKIVKTAGKELVAEIEEKGYDNL